MTCHRVCELRAGVRTAGRPRDEIDDAVPSFRHSPPSFADRTAENTTQMRRPAVGGAGIPLATS
jgi:hypothetical protein